MPVTISDEVLRQVGLSEREALIEIACYLYDTEKLGLWPAAQLAGLSRGEFEDELLKRRIAIYRYTEDLFERDSQALRKLWG